MFANFELGHCGRLHLTQQPTIQLGETIPKLLGSLSNHDDDGNKNPTNLHIRQWKTVFLHALHVHFLLFDIL